MSAYVTPRCLIIFRRWAESSTESIVSITSAPPEVNVTKMSDIDASKFIEREKRLRE